MQQEWEHGEVAPEQKDSEEKLLSFLAQLYQSYQDYLAKGKNDPKVHIRYQKIAAQIRRLYINLQMKPTFIPEAGELGKLEVLVKDFTNPSMLQ